MSRASSQELAVHLPTHRAHAHFPPRLRVSAPSRATGCKPAPRLLPRGQLGPWGPKTSQPSVSWGCRHRQSVSLTPTVSSRLLPCASGADITFTPRSPSQCHQPRDELTSPAFLRWTRWQPFSCPSVSAPNAGPASCLRSQTTKRGSGHHEIQRKTGQATVTERRTQNWHGPELMTVEVRQASAC